MIKYPPLWLRFVFVNLLWLISPVNARVNTPENVNDLLKAAEDFYQSGQLDSAGMIYNRILSGSDAGVRDKALSYTRLGTILKKSGRNSEAEEVAWKAIELYMELSDSLGLINSYTNLAKIENVQGDYRNALAHYFQALQYMKEPGDTLLRSKILGLIANLYMDIGEPEKAKDFYRQGLVLLRNYPDHNYYADELSNYAIFFFDREEYDSALYYFNEAFKIYRSDRQPAPDDIAAAYENIGITSVFLGQTSKGFDYLRTAWRLFDSLNMDNDKVSLLLDLGRAFGKIQSYDSASFYYRKASELAGRIGNAWGRKTAAELLFNLYENSGDFKQALLWHKKFVAIKDSVQNERVSKHLQNLEVRYETARREKLITELKNRELIERANNRILKGGIVALVAFITMFIFFIYLKRKKDRLIHNQKLLVARQQEALAKAELDRQNLELKKMEQELEYKTRQLTTHSISMTKKNQLLKDLTQSFDRFLVTCEGSEKNEIVKLKRELEKGLNIENDWELFRMYFEEVNKGFSEKLKKINPQLTANDFRLCALIRLNLNIKEMASVMNISPDSLKNARYRLKKKLGLKMEDDLPGFIRSL